MNFRPMGVNADLNRLDAEFAKKIGFFFANHERVGFFFDIEHPLARMPQNIEEIHAHQDFAAAQREKEDSRLGKLIKQSLHFFKRHFSVVIMVQIAVHAALVTAIGNIQVNVEGHTEPHGPGVEFFHQSGHVLRSEVRGSSPTSTRPRSRSSSTRCSASASASSGSTSNSAQTRSSTILRRGVTPSADFQISEATSFSVNRLEFTAV